MNKPKPLQKNDHIALIAPSSQVSEKERSNAIASLKFLQLTPILYPSCFSSHGYLAGTDELRAKDIHDAFSDNTIKGIFCIRGGYGCPRLLQLLDYEMIRNHPKAFLGYSDISLLHIAFNQHCDLITFHGTMPSIHWEQRDELTLRYLRDCLFGTSHSSKDSNTFQLSLENPKDEQMETIYPGEAYGEIVGGNLSRIVSTLGSPFEINTKGKLLFIEEIDEKAYDVDKMLMSLALAGKFKDCNGIILGAFQNCESILPEMGESIPLLQIFEEIISAYQKPTLYNFRAGHVYPQITFPLGAMARMSATEHTLMIL